MAIYKGYCLFLYFPQAVDSGCKRLVQFLLDKGPNWMEKDTFVNSLLDCAKKKYLTEVIEMIAEKERKKTPIRFILDEVARIIYQNYCREREIEYYEMIRFFVILKKNYVLVQFPCACDKNIYIFLFIILSELVQRDTFCVK